MKRTRLKRGSKQLKRSGFTRKPTKPRKTAKKGKQRAKKARKKGYQVPKWFKSIKPSASHGSSPTQKRYWRVVSELVRQRDFKKYKGKCCSCNRVVEEWEALQAGHYKAYSVCNSYYKWDIEHNINGQCSYCNFISDGVVGKAYSETLIKRYGADVLKKIEKNNLKYKNQKIEDHEIVERVEKLLEENKWFILP